MKTLFTTRLLLTLHLMHFCKSEIAPKLDILHRNLLPIDNSCSTREQHRYKRSFSSTTSPLHCPPCEQIHCFKQKKRRLRCKGGWTLGICGCCKVCAKLEGEQCGGQHDYLGKCDVGLVCEAQQPKVISVERNGVKTVYKIESGTCKKVSTKKLTANRSCKPKCSSEFCLENPRGICSAMDNADRLQKCQGNCQHTSCRACKYVYPNQQCSSCSKDDFKCMREFGRCVRKMSCKPKEYPCENSWRIPKHDAIFQCKVPDCSD